MSDHYILVGQTPVPVEPCDPYTPEGIEGLKKWAVAYESTDRRVAQTSVWWGCCRVSTVFLGLDHNFARHVCGNLDSPPILFETMSFWLGSGGDAHQERCSTWMEAEAQHKSIVRECRKPWVAIRCLLHALRGRRWQP